MQWSFQKYGSPEVLKQVNSEVPKLKPGQLGVKVSAISLNPIDWKIMSGQLRFLVPIKLSSVPVFDFAGVVEDVNGNNGFQMGDWLSRHKRDDFRRNGRQRLRVEVTLVRDRNICHAAAD